MARILVSATFAITPGVEVGYLSAVQFLAASSSFGFWVLWAPLFCGEAKAEDVAPTAEAGLGVMAYVGDTIILNGEGSSDPEGQPLSYAWSQVGGGTVGLADGTTARPSFSVTATGTLRFQLVVSDGVYASAPDVVAVVIPDRELQPLGVSDGCASAPYAGGAWVAGVVCLLLRRRR